MLPFEYLQEKIKRGVWLNDNHNNYDFLEFWDKFYNGEKFESVKRKFHYYMAKMVKEGSVKKAYSYLNGRDFQNFGRRTIINYQPTDPTVNPAIKYLTKTL